MKNLDLNHIFLIAVKKLILDSYRNTKNRNGMDFLKESDLKCYLVGLLLFESKQSSELARTEYNLNITINDSHNNEPKSFFAPVVFTELMLRCNAKIILKPKKRKQHINNKYIDIALLNKTSLKFTQNKTNSCTPSKYDWEANSKDVFIQLKYSWGKCPSIIKDDIKKDFRILSSVGIGHRYLVYWDYGNRDEKLIKSLKQFSIKSNTLIYINPIMGIKIYKNKIITRSNKN